MRGITISKRLLFMIGCSILALIVAGTVGLSAAWRAGNGVLSIRDQSLASIKLLSHARNEYMTVRVNVVAHARSTEDAAKETIEKELKELDASIDRSLNEYEKLLSDDTDRKFLEAERAILQKYSKMYWDHAIELSRKKQTSASMAYLTNELAPVGARLTDSFTRHIEFKEKQAVDYSEEVISTVSNAIKVSIAVIVGGALAIGGLGYLILVAIRSSLNEICQGLSRIESDLDFTVRIPIKRQDEIGLAASALNCLLDKLQMHLKAIMLQTNEVSRSAVQMAATSSKMATSSQLQSEGASNMAATVEELTVSINHVGDRANEANRISIESGELANSGGAVIVRIVDDVNKIAATVGSAAERINELVENSIQISEIVVVIKEVADQTNLLALNAAIEAARAGEQGRGFAVVADEVRKLAERTSTSTQKIAANIESMRAVADEAARSMNSVVGEVTQGVDSALEANRAIDKIGVSSRRTVEMVEEISSAIREQASAMTSLAQLVERIAQMSEEISGAARNGDDVAKGLDVLSDEMKMIVGAYRL